MKVHYPHPDKLNGTMCGKYPMVTCHIDGITCGLCKALMAKRGYFGAFIFDLSLEHARLWKTGVR